MMSTAIEAPGVESNLVSMPIYPGACVTWGDATKQGRRVPTEEQMVRICAIAPVADLVMRMLPRVLVTSWLRRTGDARSFDPTDQRQAAGISPKNCYGKWVRLTAEAFSFPNRTWIG